MLITPTLVIGIGSSGLEIANSIRDLMVEEFLTPGLPVVRFLNISSHKGGETSGESYAESHQRLEIVETSISPGLFDSVPFKLDPNSGQHMKGLEEWFDRRLLNFDRTQLESGMANTRGLGRLSLWLNWTNVTDAVRRNVEAIQNVDNSNETNNFIREYLNNPQLPIGQKFVHDVVNVVIVGSLHGGTCSGSFLDLAYYINDQYPTAKIFGHFTFMDNSLTQLPNNSQLSTNAFSALTEMDYLAAEGSSYDVQFPDTKIPKKFGSFPFTRVFLLSTMNTQGRRSALVTQQGIIKLENLHKLIALSIFFDTVGSKQNKLEGLRINWANIVYNRRFNQTPRHQKIFNSYGSLAFWYPKVRITNAAACAFMKEQFFEYWEDNKNKPNRSGVDREVTKTFEELYSSVRGNISVFIDDATGERSTITAAKDKFINNIVEELKKGSLNVGELMAKLNNEPQGRAFATRFKTNGYFYDSITLQLENAKQKASSFVKSYVESLVKNVFRSGFELQNSQNYFSLADLLEYRNKLNERISNITVPNLPVEDIDYSGCSALLDQIRIEQDRTLTAAVFMRDEVLKQYFNRFTDEIRRIYNEAERLLLDHFALSILKESQAIIDQILHTSIDKLRQSISEITNLADKELNELLDMQSFTTLRIITQTGEIKTDVIALQSRLTGAHASQILSESRDVLYDSSSSSAKIFQSLKAGTQKKLLLLTDVKQFNISSKLTDESYRQYSPDLYPLFEKAVNFAAFNYPNGQRPNLLAGGNNMIRQNIKNLIGNGDVGSFDIDLDIDLNHLIYIYKEESGIAFSEYAAYSGMEAQYRAFARQNYGFHIDRDPNKFDVEKLLNYQKMIEDKWFKVAKELFLSDLFEKQDDYLKFTFKERNGVERRLFFKKDDENDFYIKMKDNVSAFEAFKQKYQAIFNRLDKNSFQSLYRGHLENLRLYGWDLASEQYLAEEEFYFNILNKRWPQ